MKISPIILFVLPILMASTCIKPGGYNYNTGTLPEEPVNLTDFNTEYDDYNSTAPSLGSLIPFCFSTNRNNSGHNFDIIYQPMNVDFNKTTGILKVTNLYDNWAVFMDEYEVIKKGLALIETSGNEFGPNLITGYTVNSYNFTLMYSTDSTGNDDIYFTSNRTDPDFTAPHPVLYLNSEFDDLYPAFNTNHDRIYFCSNRYGNFDIYFVEVNPDTDPELLLSDTTGQYEVQREVLLSTEADDKCPFIFDNRLVFTSTRPGGYGGYDLYMSEYNGIEWTTPVNLGPSINSAYDEFRPILFNEGVSETQDMLVFSSNRPGGMGGFDLYFVGVAH